MGGIARTSALPPKPAIGAAAMRRLGPEALGDFGREALGDEFVDPPLAIAVLSEKNSETRSLTQRWRGQSRARRTHWRLWHNSGFNLIECFDKVWKHFVIVAVFQPTTGS